MEIKYCYKCNSTKSINEFNKNKSRKDGLQTKCKDCDRKRNKEYYNNSEIIRNKAKERTKKNKPIWLEKNHNFLCEYLDVHSCIDCGETDLIVLDFDHINNKNIDIAKAVRNWSLKKLQEEIKLCEVRCANCHRRKTAKQFNWKKLNWNK